MKLTPYLIETSEYNPTKVQITKMPQKGKLVAHCAGGEFRKYLSMGYKPQHLYLTTDEEIKEGDWFIDKGVTTNGKVIPLQLKKKYHTSIKGGEDSTGFISESKLQSCRKIVATTDKSLKIKEKCWCMKPESGGCYSCTKPLPQPPQSLIEYYISEYNKGNIITEIEDNFT